VGPPARTGPEKIHPHHHPPPLWSRRNAASRLFSPATLDQPTSNGDGDGDGDGSPALKLEMEQRGFPLTVSSIILVELDEEISSHVLQGVGWDESGTDIIRTDRPTKRARYSNSMTVFESGHLISVTIRTTLLSRNLMLNFYDPNTMNTTIRQKIYCPYPYSIREFFPRKKNHLYLYPQYPFVSDPFSSLVGGCYTIPAKKSCEKSL
jgi:hypothetical protein